MKKCSYCGRENSDDTVTCLECGQEIIVEGFPVKQPSEHSSHLFLSMAIGVGVGVAVTLLSLFIAWQNLRDTPLMSVQQYITRSKLCNFGKTISQWQANSTPISLDAVRQLVGTDAEDGWRNPFNFVQDGSNFIVVSYGRDAKPGGVGLDCDLTTQYPLTSRSLPTLLQFYRDLPSNGIANSCIFCGMLAFITSLLTIKVPTLNRQGILRACWRLGATVIGAVLISIVITALHVPNGH
jgi:hypothetical protein